MTEHQPQQRRPKPNPQTIRIEWARSLTNEDMEVILQNALLQSRATIPRTHAVVLLEEVVHELKSRLMRYDEVMGEPPPPKKRKYDDYENDGD